MKVHPKILEISLPFLFLNSTLQSRVFISYILKNQVFLSQSTITKSLEMVKTEFEGETKPSKTAVGRYLAYLREKTLSEENRGLVGLLQIEVMKAKALEPATFTASSQFKVAKGDLNELLQNNIET
mgnify:CR=1 FL=1